MEAFCGKWKLDREGCEGEREFYEADGSFPDPEMLEKILEADCIVSMAEVKQLYFAFFFCKSSILEG